MRVEGRGSRVEGTIAPSPRDGMRAQRVHPSTLNPRPSTRAAFTLVEVLLALALSGVLIAAVVGALEMYRRLSTAGHSETERAQLARALFDRFSDDIRAVTFRPTEKTSSSESESESEVGAADEGTGDDTEDVIVTTSGEDLDTGAAYEGGAIGITGNALSLIIHTNQPERSEATATFTLPELLQNGGRTSDQRSVTYFLASPGQAGLIAAVTQRLEAQSTDAERDRNEPLGLVRLEGDRLAMSLADETGDYTALASGATLIAPEVKAFSVRYFDGTMWQTAWDTELYQTLPRAVEITLGLRVGRAAVRQPGELGQERRPDIVEHRFVINVPQADPTPLEDLQ